MRMQETSGVEVAEVLEPNVLETEQEFWNRH